MPGGKVQVRAAGQIQPTDGRRASSRRRPAAAPAPSRRRRWPPTQTASTGRTPCASAASSSRGRSSPAVIAIIITIIGALRLSRPAGRRNIPDIVPPTVTVNAAYPGASAETVADTVAAPIEQEINGVDDMLYMSSQSTGDGRLTITVTFKLGTDLDAAQVLVQNRVALAEPRLPEEVRRLGVVARKTSPSWLMVVNLLSPDGSLDRGYISNYALTQVRDRLARVDGIGDVQLFGARDYAMRVWIDPGRAAALDLTAGEIVAGAARAERPGRRRHARPAAVRQRRRLPAQRRDAGPPHRPRSSSPTSSSAPIRERRDHARVATSRGSSSAPRIMASTPICRASRLGDPGHLPAARLQRARRRRAASRPRWRPPSKSFPPGLEYRVIYNPTEFISESIERGAEDPARGDAAGRPGHHRLPAELARGDHPGRRHPGVADRHLRGAGGARLFAQHPVAVRPGAGDRHRRRRRHRRGRECRAQPRAGPVPARGARTSMDEVVGALVAIVLVLCAVFVPTTVPHRPLGRVLPPVRGDHLGRDGHLAAAVADPVAGAGRAAAEAAERAARRNRRDGACCTAPATGSTAASTGFSDWYGRCHPPAGQRAEAGAGRLCRADRG